MFMSVGHTAAHPVDGRELRDVEAQHCPFWSVAAIHTRLKSCKLHEVEDGLYESGLPEQTELWIFYTKDAPLGHCPLHQP